jgi:hypothetical protein
MMPAAFLIYSFQYVSVLLPKQAQARLLNVCAAQH